MTIDADDARAVLAWPTEVSLGPDDVFRAYGNGGDGGEVDYDAELLGRPVPAWPAGRYPGGLGSGPLGSGSLGGGYRGSGLGNGMLGRGPLGRGSFTLTATTGKLIDGDWTFAVAGQDAAGNTDDVGDRAEADLAVAGVPEAPGVPTGGYAAALLTLTFDLSVDDEAA